MEEGNFIISGELRGMRLAGHRIRKEGFMVDDRLESGFLGIYECIGGCLYLEPKSLEGLLVAGIEIARDGEGEVGLKRVFCEFGHDDLAPLMLEQLKRFGEFYGYGIALGFKEKQSSSMQRLGQDKRLQHCCRY